MEKEKETLHIDCFAFNDSVSPSCQCCALTDRICNKKECSFYARWDDIDDITRRLIKDQKKTFGDR